MKKKLAFTDLFSLNEHIADEAYRKVIQTEVLSELAAADIILLLVNGQAFRDFREKISWIKETMLQFKKPLIFIKLPPSNKEDIEYVRVNIGEPVSQIPGYDMFHNVQDARLKEYVEGLFREDSTARCSNRNNNTPDNRNNNLGFRLANTALTSRMPAFTDAGSVNELSSRLIRHALAASDTCQPARLVGFG